MDQILDNFVGGHGKYQITITIATSLINEFANGIFLMHIFTAYAPKHRCRVPQCETINATKVSLTRDTNPLLISTGFLKFLLELKKKIQ